MTRALSKSRPVPRRGLSREEALAQAKDIATFIYFVRAGEFVKIGRAKDWKLRIQTMQTGSPCVLQPLLVLTGDDETENQLHFKFYRDKYRGEWFHNSEAIRKFIQENLQKCFIASGVHKIECTLTWDNYPKVVL